MATTITDLNTNVRSLCGDPSTTELAVATVQRYLEQFALRWINKRRPKVTLTSFDTVADQQDYDEIPATAYAVRNVYWIAGSYEFFSDSLQNYYVQALENTDVHMAGYRTVDNPALVEIMLKALQEYNVNFRGEGFGTPERLIRLVPVPGVSGDAVYFDYWAPRWSSVVAVDLLTEYQDAVELYAAGRLLGGPLAIKRGLIRGSRGYSGGGGQNEKELAKQYLEDAEGLCPVAGAVFARG